MYGDVYHTGDKVGRFLKSKPFSLFFIIFGVLSRDWFIASCKFCYLQNNTNHAHQKYLTRSVVRARG